MTTSPTQGEHAQTDAQPIQRFEVVDCIDSKHVPAVIPRKDGPWVRYEDHAAELRRLHAQVAALTAQPAPQGVAYAELPEPDSYLFQHDETGLTQFVDAQQVEWGFQQNNPRLHRIGGAYTADQMRDFADRTHALRASNGQAPAGATLPAGWVPLVITHEGQYPEEVAYGPQILMDRLGKWLRKYFDSVVADKAGSAGAVPDLQPLHNLLYLAQRQTSPGAMQRVVGEARLELAKVRDVTPTAQAAPAAGAVAGPVLWVSPEQLAGFVDKDVEPFGSYIPARKTSAGKFTMPLFAAAPTPAAGAVVGPSDDEILNRTGVPYAPGTREYDLDLIRWYRDRIAAAPTPAAQADSQPMLRDWTTSDDPVQALDAIMAVYEKCMGTTPGPEMAHVVSKTKEMLFDWWGRYRERAREALTKADSVLEDAELLEFEMQHGAAINAARKQGGTHD